MWKKLQVAKALHGQWFPVPLISFLDVSFVVVILTPRIDVNTSYYDDDNNDDNDNDYDDDNIDDDDVNILHNHNNNNQIRLGNISSSLEKPKISFSLTSASAKPSSTHTDGAPNLYNAVTNRNMTFST